jgi:hypothetical protein
VCVCVCAGVCVCVCVCMFRKNGVNEVLYCCCYQTLAVSMQAKCFGHVINTMVSFLKVPGANPDRQ